MEFTFQGLGPDLLGRGFLFKCMNPNGKLVHHIF